MTHAVVLSDHPPVLGGPSLGTKLAKPIRPALVLELPLARRCLPCHYVDARSPGRGPTEYKVYRHRLSLCRFEVNVGEVFTASKKRGERENVFKVFNHRGQLAHLHSELVDPLIKGKENARIYVNRAL